MVSIKLSILLQTFPHFNHLFSFQFLNFQSYPFHLYFSFLSAASQFLTILKQSIMVISDHIKWVWTLELSNSGYGHPSEHLDSLSFTIDTVLKNSECVTLCKCVLQQSQVYYFPNSCQLSFIFMLLCHLYLCCFVVESCSFELCTCEGQPGATKLLSWHGLRKALKFKPLLWVYCRQPSLLQCRAKNWSQWSICGSKYTLAF